MDRLGAAFFARDVVTVARDLIGASLLVDGIGGPIVETEAYAAEEPASHAFRGQTRHNRVMFGPPGHAYVYFSYGVHWCLNFVAGERTGSAVLIRAIQPSHGIDVMATRRGLDAPLRLASGPGKLCQALGVSATHNGAPLDKPPFAILAHAGDAVPVAAGRRIGITKAVDLPWRFGLAGSPFLSRPIIG
jgi:DNA-3-methyladenine glycosylase